MIDLKPVDDFLVDADEDLVVNADELGFVVHSGHRFLTFLQDRSFLSEISANDDIVAVLCSPDLVADAQFGKARIIPTTHPRLAFTTLHNSLKPYYQESKSVIASSAQIHPTAQISSVGVVIHEDVLIEANAVILAGTTIGKNSIIRSGAVIGSEALDIRDSENGPFIMSKHLGGVRLDDYVEVGQNSVVDRAIFRHQETTIGFSTKIGALTNISHGVMIGEKNKIAAGVQICGGTRIGDNNWFGPKSIVSHMLTIGSKVFVSLGSVVLQDLQDEWKVVNSRVFRERKLF